MNSLYIKKIRTLEELKVSVEVLIKGFIWSWDYADLMIESLLNNKKKIDFYGFTLNDENDKLIGVILTLYQGFIETSDKEIIIINLSSWFVLEEHRGYKSIFMLKKVTKELSNFIVTNYSPNNSAKAILKALGYKYLKTCTKNYYLYKFLPKIFVNLIFGDFIIKNIKNKYLKNKFINYRDSKYIELNIKGETIDLLITESHLSKNIVFLNFISIKVPRLHILWCSDNNLFEEKFTSICASLFYKYKTYIISIHCLDSTFLPFKNTWRNHFYKSPKDSNQKPFLAGSEFSINF